MAPGKMAARIGAALALALTAGCAFDTAALIDPDTTVIRADPGQVRVLRYSDDPAAGDAWIDLLEPDPSVVVEDTEFREFDARRAGDGHRADRRRVFSTVGEGATLLVEMNCRGCEDGVPPAVPEQVDLHVWHFVVGAVGDDVDALRLGAAVARADQSTQVVLGDYVLVVRPASEGPGRITAIDSTVLLPVASDGPERGAALYLDVFLARRPGETTVQIQLEDRSERTYPVAVD